MTEPPAQAERIDLRRADDPRDVVHRVVACLAQGGVVALPTGDGYGLVAGALNPGAAAILASAGDFGPPTLVIKGADELADWAPGIAASTLKLARRVWPGPLILVLKGRVDDGLGARLPAEVRQLVGRNSSLTVTAPGHELLRQALRLLPGPVIVAGRSSRAEDLAGVPGVSMVVDDGPPGPGAGPTVVEVDGERRSIVSEGSIGAEELSRMAGTMILFVCTGNTCRSPMAEALCKAELARRIGCEPVALEAQGYTVISAGVAAHPGMPAAAHAVEVVKARGGSLKEHASRQVTASLVEMADHILAMTADHLDILLDHAPEAAPKARLIDPSGGDLADPIGAGREVYHETAREIESHLRRLIDELGVIGRREA